MAASPIDTAMRRAERVRVIIMSSYAGAAKHAGLIAR
jgi:hypothetical protein